MRTLYHDPDELRGDVAVPMDMPPQQVVEYRVAPVKAEAPKSIHQQVARFLGAERIRAEQKAGITIGSFDAARKLPPMDFSSPKLTQAERQGVAMVLDASQANRLGSAGVTMKDGYVARRMGAAVLTARLAERSQAGYEVSAKQIDAVRCRLVAVVMDPRAADYVKGGERAAAASRAALSKGDVELCRPSIEAQARRISAERRSVSPTATGAAPARTSATPVAERLAAVSVSPKGTPRQRVDLPGSTRQRIDPMGSSHMAIIAKGRQLAENDPDEFSRRMAIVGRVLGSGNGR
jgi:hypothetical protein